MTSQQSVSRLYRQVLTNYVTCVSSMLSVNQKYIKVGVFYAVANQDYIGVRSDRESFLGSLSIQEHIEVRSKHGCHLCHLPVQQNIEA